MKYRNYLVLWNSSSSTRLGTATQIPIRGMMEIRLYPTRPQSHTVRKHTPADTTPWLRKRMKSKQS